MIIIIDRKVMLSYIIGEVAEISADTVVIENNGIGFNIKHRL